jgi:hypothetical protein
MPELAEAQGRLLAAIAAPTREAWDAALPLIAAGSLTAERRLGLYARGYRARLLECLRGEYPALRALMGDPVFELFADGYLAAHPPASPSLHELGASFPDWLRAGRPDAAPGSVEALPASLARLERAWSQALRAPGPERLGPVPDDLLLRPGGRLRLPGSTRLLRLDFDFLPLMAATAAGAEAPSPVAGETLTVVARSRYRVALHSLTPGRFAWLEALGPEGAEGLAASARAAAETGLDAGGLLAELILWLPVAVESGMVVTA